jgi:hypothetical protein
MLDTSIGHVPHILQRIEVVLSHWKTNMVLFLCRFAEFSFDLTKTGMGPLINCPWSNLRVNVCPLSNKRTPHSLE